MAKLLCYSLVLSHEVANQKWIKKFWRKFNFSFLCILHRIVHSISFVFSGNYCDYCCYFSSSRRFSSRFNVILAVTCFLTTDFTVNHFHFWFVMILVNTSLFTADIAALHFGSSYLRHPFHVYYFRCSDSFIKLYNFALSLRYQRSFLSSFPPVIMFFF